MKEFVIKKRNKDNSVFIVQRKLSKKWKWASCLIDNLKLKERQIINLINNNVKFYTYHREEKRYTPVFKRGCHIQSKANATKKDNIKNLPLF